MALEIFACRSQNKEVTAAGSTISLSAIDPDLKASAISNLKGATLSGDKLTNITGDTVTYDYATGYNDTKMDVTPNIKTADTRTGLYSVSASGSTSKTVNRIPHLQGLQRHQAVNGIM